MQRAATPCDPLVSAVIPTRGRPALVLSAIRSALRQTWHPLEVVVVLDGPDPETAAHLATIADPRVRVLPLPERAGGSAARNAGVEAARGEWIAFLDDDDEWFPDKIERQMEAVRHATVWFPVITCRVVAQSPRSSRVLPQRSYDGAQPVPDYLFCRHGLADPGGLMQTSTLLAQRDLLLAIPFRNGLPGHQDWDWIIRATACEGVAVTMLAKPLSLWRVEDGRDSISRKSAWQFSLAWIREMRPLISGRAFAAFVAIQCVWRARKSRAGATARLAILRAFLFEGTPDLLASLHFALFSLVPTSLRRAARDFAGSRRDPAAARGGLTLVHSRPAAPRMLRKSSF
ncbi:MAG TPA: glycosyltransferase family 2 protein [Acidobacteriaceae bacterium]|nr:glycosyltransferase family 2 protein [Acidobacteriaceae bacterium]